MAAYGPETTITITVSPEVGDQIRALALANGRRDEECVVDILHAFFSFKRLLVGGRVAAPEQPRPIELPASQLPEKKHLSVVQVVMMISALLGALGAAAYIYFKNF